MILASFVLESVFIATAPNFVMKKNPGAYNVCYTFRSHDARGGYGSPEMAVQMFGTLKAKHESNITMLGPVADA